MSLLIMNKIPTVIIPHPVNSSGFIKYSKLSISAAGDILPFYKDTQTQAVQYNIVLLPSKEDLTR